MAASMVNIRFVLAKMCSLRNFYNRPLTTDPYYNFNKLRFVGVYRAARRAASS